MAGVAAFVAAWVLIFCFSSTKLVGFDLGILGICLVVLGVDLSYVEIGSRK